MTEATLNVWSSGPLPAGVEALLGRLRRTEGVRQIAVMPDVHLASEFCVGTVVASENMLFPNAVGGDIGCGMLALRFNASADLLADPQRAARLLGALNAACPARRHHRAMAHPLPLSLRDMPLSHPHLEAQKLSPDACCQLGTLGAGNHFLELQREETTDALWLMLHTGSRHLGQCVLRHHLPKSRRLDTGIMALEADTPEGRAYAADVAVARVWARENRRLLAISAVSEIERLLGVRAQLESQFDCDHNHLIRETHAGKELWIHRKGATYAAQDVPGIVPGSMGTRSFHTLGRGSSPALHSSSHGAGRALSRTEARQCLSVSALRAQMRGVWYDARIERQLLEEAPGAYKDVDRVMASQEELTQVVRRLRPLLVYKGV